MKYILILFIYLGGYNNGSEILMQYLLLGRSGQDLKQVTLPMELNDFDDCIINISKNSTCIYCNNELYDVLLPLLCHIPNILFYHLFKGEDDDVDCAQLFKIRSFIEMTKPYKVFLIII